MNENLKDLIEKIKIFCEERDWNQFHNPKDLAIGISTESGELLDIFRFQKEDQIEELFKDKKKREHIEEELADVLFFVLRFAQMNDIDLNHALETKIKKNAEKYPIQLSKGTNKKYNEL